MRPFHFFGFLTLCFFITLLASFVVYKVLTIYSGGSLTFVPTLFASVAFAAPLLLLISMVLGRNRYHPMIALVYTITMFWVPILLWLFIATIALAAFYVVSVYMSISLPNTEILIAMFSSIGVLIGFGIFRAWNPKLVRHSFSIPSLTSSWKDKRIVLISDTHLGMVRNRKFLESLVQKINNENPDLVLIAGDLLDGPALPYKEVLAPLSQLQSTHGTFFTSGNHDQYNLHQDEYYGELKKHVTVLDDAKITINGTELIGIAYGNELPTQTQERLKKALYDKNIPAIAVLHDPKNAEALAEAGVPLILSGHTHGGQFFPISSIVRALYKERARGVYRIGESIGFTSLGAGTGGPLLRINARPEIVVITIN